LLDRSFDHTVDAELARSSEGVFSAVGVRLNRRGRADREVLSVAEAVDQCVGERDANVLVPGAVETAERKDGDRANLPEVGLRACARAEGNRQDDDRRDCDNRKPAERRERRPAGRLSSRFGR
jgi:hypothetical protein